MRVWKEGIQLMMMMMKLPDAIHSDIIKVSGADM